MTTKKPNSRKIQAEESRLKILDAALEVFAAKGFGSSSIKDIAEAAGVSNGLMYHYFTGKEDLLAATIKHHSFIGELRKALADQEDQPASRVLRDIAERFMDTLEAKKALVKILIRDVAFDPDISDAWAKLFHEGVSLLKGYIESRIARGEFKPHNTEVSARCLLYCVVMFHITRDIFKSSPVTREEYIEQVLKNVLTGIVQD